MEFFQLIRKLTLIDSDQIFQQKVWKQKKFKSWNVDTEIKRILLINKFIIVALFVEFFLGKVLFTAQRLTLWQFFLRITVVWRPTLIWNSRVWWMTLLHFLVSSLFTIQDQG